MNRIVLFYLALYVCFFTQCKSAKFAEAPNPGERYTMTEEKPLLSTITIPVAISIDDLVNSLNARLQGVLYEDYSFTDNGNDNLMLRLTKIQPISMLLSGNTFKYRVPLNVWAKQKLFLGSAEVQGDLALNMKTTFSVNPDWSLRTQTEVEHHEWLTKPVLKTGLGDISIESLANLALNRSKVSLSQTLDRMVSQQFSLRPYVQEAWSALQVPVLLNEDYRTWIKTTPVSIAMTPLLTENNILRASIAVECYNDVSFGEKPAFRENSNLPNLRMIHQAPEVFQLQIVTDVPFAEAELLARSMMLGQVFESGKRKVKVEDLELWGNDDRMVVKTKLSGSFNGIIYFMGRPVYNPDRNRIEVTDLDFHTETRNFLHRSAAWLFSGTIKRRMAESMAFPLDENISELKNSIHQTLQYYEIRPGVILKGAVDQLSVDQTGVTPTGLRVNLLLNGKVQVDVRGL